MSAITKSAKGEECQVRYVGTCTYNAEHTIWSHCRHGAAGRGKAIKALDLAGAYACTSCDAVYDGQKKTANEETRDQLDLDWYHGHVRSLVILDKKGLICA